MHASVRLAVYTVLSLLILIAPAHAYLDPGTGSILLQGLIAGIAGAIVAARLYWGKVKDFLTFSKRKGSSAGKNAGS